MKQRFNNLTGKEWLKYSISIWSDIQKGSEERVNHPAIFPCALVERILKCYTRERVTLLDPFAGSGTVLYVGVLMNHKVIGFEVYEKYVKLIKERLGLFNSNCILIHDTVENAGKYLQEDSIDLIITSPPYWDILSRNRTADKKAKRDYGKSSYDLSCIEDYDEYIERLSRIFINLRKYLKRDSYIFINVMDIRKKKDFYALHVDICNSLVEHYKLEDIIIWDRRKEYNNLKPLGYPYRFIINRVHEYILVFRKI